MLFALPDHTRFSLVDFPLHLPLELLGVDLCIRVLTLIMLENKVSTCLFSCCDWSCSFLGRFSITWLQCTDHECLSLRRIALSIGVHVSCHSTVTNMYDWCRTGLTREQRGQRNSNCICLASTHSDTVYHWCSSQFLSLQRYANEEIRRYLDCWSGCQSGEFVVLLSMKTSLFVRSQIIQPRLTDPFFDIPEFEYTILSNHLKQALGSMSIDPEPIQSFDAMLNDKSYMMSANSTIPLPSTAYNPFIYGNDVDSVDIATRVAMVRFFNSPNILGNFNEHTRTLRLHPRAVVAFQYSSFVRSRPVKSSFIIRLAKTQVRAIESRSRRVIHALVI